MSKIEIISNVFHQKVYDEEQMVELKDVNTVSVQYSNEYSQSIICFNRHQKTEVMVAFERKDDAQKAFTMINDWFKEKNSDNGKIIKIEETEPETRG